MKRSAILAAGLALAMIAGCGRSEPPPADPSVPETPVNGDTRFTIPTGRLAFSNSRPDGTLTWEGEAEASRNVVAQDGAVRSELSGVQGTLYDEDGAPISRFFGESAFVDGTERRLRVTGQVRIEDLQDDVVITGDELEYQDDEAIIKMRGRVTILAPRLGFESGPLPEVWARRDLSQFGTPRGFQNAAP